MWTLAVGCQLIIIFSWQSTSFLSISPSYLLHIFTFGTNKNQNANISTVYLFSNWNWFWSCYLLYAIHTIWHISKTLIWCITMVMVNWSKDLTTKWKKNMNVESDCIYRRYIYREHLNCINIICSCYFYFHHTFFY